MAEDITPTADTLGAGLVLGEDGRVSVVLMVGSGGDYTVAAPLDIVTAESVVVHLQQMILEARLVQEAVMTMPLESAKQYVENWAARQRKSESTD